MFFAPESDSPHKIMQNRVYFSTLLSRLFPYDQYDQIQMFFARLVPASFFLSVFGFEDPS